MSTVEGKIELENTNHDSQKTCETVWSPRVYRCHVCIIHEDDDTFSAIVLNLPGCGSCGDTEEEAIANVRDAVVGVVESHDAAGEKTPWRDAEAGDIPMGAKQKWILVNA